MKQIFRFASALAAAAALFAGCQKVEEQMTDEIVKAPVDLTDAIVATYSATTKVVDSENGLVWEENDSIAVAMRGHDFIPYYMVQLDEACKTAWFRTDAKADDERPFVDRNVAFSPLQAAGLIAEGSETICHTLPAVQEYNAAGFLGKFFPMAAVTEHGYQTEFAFKNICGVLVLQLTGAGDEVETIILRGNNNEPLYGAAVTKVSAEEAPVIAELTIEPNEEGEVEEYGLTLDVAGNDVILGEEATKFWFVIPPTTFANGITVEVITTDGYHDFITTDKEVVVGRSEELIMDPVFKQPKPQYPAMALVAEAEGNLVHLSWSMEEREHPSETPRNPGDDTVGVAKSILTFGEEEIEIPAEMTDTTLVLDAEVEYSFEMVTFPTDTMMYKPSAVATAEATTSYFDIAALNAIANELLPAENKASASLADYAGRLYKGVICANDANSNFANKIAVENIDADGPGQGVTIYGRAYADTVTYAFGKTVVIKIADNATVQNFNGLCELVDVQATVTDADAVELAPLAVAAADLAEYEGMYVAVSGLQYAYEATPTAMPLDPWNDAASKGNRTFTNGTESFIVYTGMNVPWASEIINPEQKDGTVAGVVSVYNVTELLPLYPENIIDFKYTPREPENPEPENPEPENPENPEPENPDQPGTTSMFDFPVIYSSVETSERLTTCTVEPVTLTFTKLSNGSTYPAYYKNNESVRIYSENTVTVEAGGKTIKKITIETVSGVSNLGSKNGPLSLSGSVATWTGNSTSVVLTTSGQVRIAKMNVVYE